LVPSNIDVISVNGYVRMYNGISKILKIEAEGTHTTHTSMAEYIVEKYQSRV